MLNVCRPVIEAGQCEYRLFNLFGGSSPYRVDAASLAIALFLSWVQVTTLPPATTIFIQAGRSATIIMLNVKQNPPCANRFQHIHGDPQATKLYYNFMKGERSGKRKRKVKGEGERSPSFSPLAFARSVNRFHSKII